MSEQINENPQQQPQPGAEDTAPTDQPTAPGAAEARQAQLDAQASTSVTDIPLRLVKRATGDTHWNVAKGIYEIVTHAETGEPTQEYALLATIDGVEVPLETYNAGRVDTAAASLARAQQSQQTEG